MCRATKRRGEQCVVSRRAACRADNPSARPGPCGPRRATTAARLTLAVEIFGRPRLASGIRAARNTTCPRSSATSVPQLPLPAAVREAVLADLWRLPVSSAASWLRLDGSASTLSSTNHQLRDNPPQAPRPRVRPRLFRHPDHIRLPTSNHHFDNTQARELAVLRSCGGTH